MSHPASIQQATITPLPSDSETRLVRDLVTQPSVPPQGPRELNQSASELSGRVIDTTLRVETPENVAFEYQLAGPFRRIFAYWLDLVISIFGFMFLAGLFFIVMNMLVLPLAAMYGMAELAIGFMMLVSGMTLVLYFIVYWFYGAVMETYFNGRTFGKRIARLRVLTVDGHSIDGVQAVLRNFFRLLDLAPLLPISVLFIIDDPDLERGLNNVAFPSCMIALIVMAFSRRFQRLGDLVAGTVVVSESEGIRPTLITFVDPRVPLLAELIPLSFVPSAKLVKAVADYADQRRHLSVQRAREIAGHVAKPLLDRFGLAADTDYDLFLCALYYRIFVSMSAEGGNE